MKHTRPDGIDPHARSRARRRALQALYAWQLSNTAITKVIEQFRNEQDMEVADLEYFEDVVRASRRTSRRWTKPWRLSSTAASTRSTRSSARCCASPPTSCAIARTCPTGW